MRRRIGIISIQKERFTTYGVITHCPVCRASSELLTPVQAAALAQVVLDDIDRWLAEGQMHSASTPDGEQRICRNSLLSFGELNAEEG
jgi:hypothetical protein